MARMIPSQPVGKVSPEVATVFRRLKQIQSDDCVCWQSLPLSDTVRPEFLVIHQQCRAYLLSVSSITAEAAEDVIQAGLFTTDDQLTPSTFGLREMGALEAFSNDVGRELGLSNAPLELLERAILFPNVPQAILDRIRQIRPSEGFGFWGKEMLAVNRLSELLTREIKSSAQSPNLFQILRQQFSPEIEVPAVMVGRVRAKRELAANMTRSILDLDQEMVAKLDLSLSPDAEDAVSAGRARLITGVAGSGKSLVLLYRAMMIAKLHPRSRVLILTHNRALSGDLNDRFSRISGNATVDWGTFYQWLRRCMTSHWRELVSFRERQDTIRRIIGENPVWRDARSVDFLLEEISWIKDQGITNLKDYLETPRNGRGRALQEGQRREVFEVFKQYQDWLVDIQKDDWENIPIRALRLIEDGKVKLPAYDFVFIDEAQFFAPVWFDIVRRVVSPDRGQLFMAADPTQGFLKRRISWVGSGIDIRGRSMKLQHSYRNSRQILSFAAHFYRTRLPEDDEEINLPDGDEWNNLPEGKEPRFIELDAAQDAITRTANEVLSAIANGFPPGWILILAADPFMVDPILDHINRDRRCAINVQREDFDAEKVKVCSLAAGTGLEAPVVFLVGIDTLIDSETDFNLSDGERQELVRDNTRRIYMGMTRASQMLILVTRNARTRLVLEGKSCESLVL